MIPSDNKIDYVGMLSLGFFEILWGKRANYISLISILIPAN
jgi:hypothetical protein